MLQGSKPLPYIGGRRTKVRVKIHFFYLMYQIYAFAALLAASAAAIGEPTMMCAGAFRLTLKGYVSNGRRPEDVCAPAPSTCARPAGAYLHYVKMCAGLVMGKNLLSPLFVTANITWVESYSLAHPFTAHALLAARARRWPVITVLRHPIDRIVAHYFATRNEESFAEWVRRNTLPPPRRGHDGSTRLWMELSNVYTKIFSSHDLKRDGPRLSPDAVDVAERRLALHFDVVAIAEYLESPLSVALLGDVLCFAHDRGVVSGKLVPSVRRSRRARGPATAATGPEAFRAASYSDPDWWRSLRPTLDELVRQNTLDLALYDRMARHSANAMHAHWRAADYGLLPVLPPLPCSADRDAHCWDLERGGPPANSALAI